MKLYAVITSNHFIGPRRRARLRSYKRKEVAMALLAIKFSSRFFFDCVKCAATGNSRAIVLLTFSLFWGRTRLSHSMIRIEPPCSSFSSLASTVKTNAPSASKYCTIR